MGWWARFRLWWKIRQLDRISQSLYGKPDYFGGFDLQQETLAIPEGVEYPDEIVVFEQKWERRGSRLVWGDHIERRVRRPT